MFHPIQLCTLCQFNSNTSPVIFTELHRGAMEWERFFACVAASGYHVTTKEMKNHIFRHNRIFRHTHTHMLGIQPTLTNSGIILFLPKYYIIISDTLVDSLLEALFLLLDVMLSGLHGKPRRN